MIALQAALLAERAELDAQSAQDALMALTLQEAEMDASLRQMLPAGCPLEIKASEIRDEQPVRTAEREAVQQKLLSYGEAGA